MAGCCFLVGKKLEFILFGQFLFVCSAFVCLLNTHRHTHTHLCVSFWVTGGAEGYPSGHWPEGRIHPGQVASPSQGTAVNSAGYFNTV